MLRQKLNPHTGRKEYCIVSHTGRALKWFGPEKPSPDWFKKEEARVEMFKNMRGRK